MECAAFRLVFPLPLPRFVCLRRVALGLLAAVWFFFAKVSFIHVFIHLKHKHERKQSARSRATKKRILLPVFPFVCLLLLLLVHSSVPLSFVVAPLWVFGLCCLCLFLFAPQSGWLDGSEAERANEHHERMCDQAFHNSKHASKQASKCKIKWLGFLYAFFVLPLPFRLVGCVVCLFLWLWVLRTVRAINESIHPSVSPCKCGVYVRSSSFPFGFPSFICSLWAFFSGHLFLHWASSCFFFGFVVCVCCLLGGWRGERCADNPVV